MVKASDNEFPSVLFEKSVDPATPSTGTARVFIDSADDVLKWIDDDGTVTDLDGGGSSPLTTKGDLYTYSTEDARLAVGSDGQVLTADSAEATGVKWAAGGGGSSAFSGASVYKSANETGLNGNQTVAWNAEHFDTDTYHDNATNNSRLTVPDTAYYRVSFVMYLYALDDNKDYQILLQINGAGTRYNTWQRADLGTDTTNIVHASRIFSLTASDYVELQVDTSDTSWNIGGAVHTSAFTIEKLGT